MRAVAELMLVLAIFAVGYLIPLPGLDPAAVDRVAGPDNGMGAALARLSIFALGALPLCRVLGWLELVRLIFPGLARWQAASERNHMMVWRVILVLALALSALQGYGLARALEAMEMVQETAGFFVPVAVGCYVGVTAFLAWLVGRIRLPSPGTGYWVMLVAPLFLLAPSGVGSAAEMFRVGALSVQDALIIGVGMAVGVGLVVYANLLLAGGSSAPPGPLSISVLLWPPFLSNMVSNAVMGAYVETWGLHTTGVIMGVKAVLELLLILLFVLLYRRMPGAGGERGLPLPVLLTVAGIQFVVCAGRDLAMYQLHVPQLPAGAIFIALVTVMWACWVRLRDGQGEGAPDGRGRAI